MQNIHDFADADFLKRMSELYITFSSNPGQSFLEHYVRYGYVLSVTDYGRYTTLSIQEFIQRVREQIATGTYRYSDFLNKDGEEPNRLLVVMKFQGYSVAPVHRNG